MNDKQLEYHICTLSYNSEAFCDGDCENCRLYQNYLEQYVALSRNNIKKETKT